MSEFLKYPRGSEWRKWDLHIHTPCSYVNSYQNWERFIEKLNAVTKAKDIKVLGITDYFSIDGYKKIVTFHKDKLEGIELILPNIEFRLDNIVYRRGHKEPKRINFHVIFSDEVKIEDIETQFLGDLHFYKSSGGAGELSKIKLEKMAIENYGRECKRQRDFQNMTDIAAGAMNIVFKLDEIVSVLKNKSEYFKGKYLIFLESEFWSDIDWGQDYGLRKTLLQVSHGIFDSNPNDVLWFLGRNSNDYPCQSDFIKEFNRLFPCIHGSDAHNEDELESKPDLDRFCWIKADPTYEGLRQIIYEPEERVKIQQENPEYRKSIFTINSIDISNSVINRDLHLIEDEFLLNQNLITVIGGKGSGKTAFLDLIVNCFEDRCYRQGINREDKNSFIQRIENDKPDLKTRISFINKDIPMFDKEVIENKYFNESTVVYLPQGKIEELSSDRIELQQKIEDIIFNNDNIKESKLIDQFDNIRHKLSEIKQGVKDLNRAIFDLELETKDAAIIALNSDINKLLGMLKDKQDEINKSQIKLDVDKRKEIELLKKKELDMRDNHSHLTELVTDIEELENDLSAFSQTITESISSIDDKLNEIFSSNSKLSIPSVNFKKQYLQIAKIKDILMQKKREIEKNIKNLTKKISLYADEEKRHAKLIKEKEEIESKIKSVRRKLQTIESKKDKLKELKEKRKENYFSLVDTYKNFKIIYMEIICIFSKGKGKVLQDVEFVADIFGDTAKFIEIGKEILDLRRTDETRLLEVSCLFPTFFEDTNLMENVEQYLNHESEFRSYLKPVKGNLLLFLEWFWGDYFSLHTEILFNKIELKKLSIGQRGTVLLKLLLAEGDTPLIIDQPEENLDNKFVYETLVDAFKEAKKKRQIIIATHNANLVVNADAEQVIVAEFKNNEITYKSGSIENTNTRNEITTILEGGKEAFEKREKKYGFA